MQSWFHPGSVVFGTEPCSSANADVAAGTEILWKVRSSSGSKSCNSLFRLEALLLKKDQLHRAHKNKVSFFRPGRLVNDDDGSHISECQTADSIKPDPLNVSTNFNPQGIQSPDKLIHLS